MTTTKTQKIVILGTGGTISGSASNADDVLGYTAGQVGVSELAQSMGEPVDGLICVTEQIAQIDSKDMSLAVWRPLLERCAHWLAQPDVKGMVVTHGTDTIEETAFFLDSVLPTELTRHKAVVLTCAMRPASAHMPDGPQNLREAVLVASHGQANGVMVSCAGRIHAACHVQKVHSYRLDPFDSADAAVLGYVEAQQVRWLTISGVPSRGHQALLQAVLKATRLPWVEVVLSHADTQGHLIQSVLAWHGADQPLRGLVVAGTGNGTVHQALQVQLERASEKGIVVVRATRCSQGRVLPTEQAPWPDSGGLSPVKARLALALSLLPNQN